MEPIDRVRRRLITYFDGRDRAAAVTDTDARDDARLLLTEALRVNDDGEVEVRAEQVEVAATLFWCRWLESPGDHEDPDCQTAFRLFRVLVAVDPQTPLPPQLVEPLSDPANEETVARLLHYESLDLIEGSLRQFDDIAVDLGISLGRCAVALTEPDTAELAEHSCDLGAGLFARYQHHGAPADLDEAVAVFRACAASGFGGSGFGGPEEQARYLANLGVALHTRFQRGGSESDLAEAVGAHRRALRRLPGAARYRSQYAAVLHTRFEVHGHPRDLNRAIALGEPLPDVNFALMLRHRFEHSGDLDDLQRSVELLSEILDGTADTDPDRARRLAALGAALAMRFTVTDSPADLDTAIDLHEQAVAIARDDDPHRLDHLSNLGHALHDRYEERGDVGDLRAALATHHRARSDDNPLRAGNHANSLAARFDHADDIADLDRALQAYLDALRVLPPGHIHRGNHLSNLGSVWFERFQRTQDLDDLEKAITADRDSVRRTPLAHIDRSRRLVNLAMALDSRYERAGDPADLDEAIELHREAYRIAPVTRRGHHGSALAIALHLRFHLRGRDDDLTEAITLLREAVDCRDDHPDRPRRRTLLASALITRHNEHGEPADIAEAVTLMRAAVAGTPPRHVQRVGRQAMLGSTLAKTGDPVLIDEAVEVLEAVAGLDASSPLGYRLRTLGDAREDRWELTGSPDDLRAAIDAYRRAIDATPATDPDQALNRYDLGRALAALADVTDRPEPRREAIEQYRAATGQPSAAVLIRIHAAGEWAAQALALGEPGSALAGFAAAVELLPRLAWTGLGRRDQERAVRAWNTLASDATAAALAAGRPDRAVEVGDQGRSLLWEQQLRLRRDDRELAQRHPRQAARLGRVRDRLLTTVRR